MKATLDLAAIKVAYAAASKDTRPILKHVKIGNGEIIACDGFILARRKIITEPETEEVMLVNAATILKTHKMLGGEQLIIESKEDGVAIISNEEEDSPLISTQLLQAEYPEYEQITPTSERKAYVVLNTFYLAKLLKIVDLEKSIVVKIKVREPNEPVEILSHETTVYIMPYFSPEEGNV